MSKRYHALVGLSVVGLSRLPFPVFAAPLTITVPTLVLLACRRNCNYWPAMILTGAPRRVTGKETIDPIAVPAASWRLAPGLALTPCSRTSRS